VEKVTAPEFAGIVSGGSAGHGQYVYLNVRLGDKDQDMVIEKSRVGAFMLGLATAAGLARAERVAHDPSELSGEGLDAAYALKVATVSVGRSSQPGVAVLDVQIDADAAGTMNLYLAAGREAIQSLRSACDDALVALNSSPSPMRPN